MKKAVLVFILLAAVVLNGCTSYNPLYGDPVLATLPAYTQQQFYSCGVFEEHTDYGKITFDEIEEADLQGSAYFHFVSDEDMESAELYMDNYEKRIEARRSDDCGAELTENYDFDRSCINVGDYICIKGDGNHYNEDISVYDMFSYYSIYFFDVESSILYYFHNNT